MKRKREEHPLRNYAEQYFTRFPHGHLIDYLEWFRREIPLELSDKKDLHRLYKENANPTCLSTFAVSSWPLGHCGVTSYPLCTCK